MAVDTLEEGRSYIFSAQVQNVFGRSNSSGVSENVTIPFSDEGIYMQHLLYVQSHDLFLAVVLCVL